MKLKGSGQAKIGLKTTLDIVDGPKNSAALILLSAGTACWDMKWWGYLNVHLPSLLAVVPLQLNAQGAATWTFTTPALKGLRIYFQGFGVGAHPTTHDLSNALVIYFS